MEQIILEDGVEKLRIVVLRRWISHHFNLPICRLESVPAKVYAQGVLEYYGKNNEFRGLNYRTYDHKKPAYFFRTLRKVKPSLKYM
jgi:hypothetical protein